MRLSTRLAFASLTVAMVALLTGCSPGGYKVTGKIVQNGNPIKVSPKGVIQMSFIEDADKDATNPFPVSVNADGTFTVAGRGSLAGPPAGKYRVSVRLTDPYPGKDKFADRYSPKNSKLVVDVKGNEDLTVDVSKDGGS